MTQTELEREVRETVNEKLATGESVPAQWLVHAIMAAHGDINGDDADFAVLCSHAHVRRTVREVLRDDFSTKEEDESQTSFPGEAFGGLQHAYLVHDGDERMVVPIEKMSAAQCWEKVAELEQMAKGCIRHSEAMRRWIGVTFPEQAAAQ